MAVDAERRARWAAQDRAAFRACFQADTKKLADHGRRALTNIHDFCFAGHSAIDPARPFTAEQLILAEGRRQVYLHIANLLSISESELREAILTTIRERRDVLSTED
jgi:hypothetical protein